MAWEFMCNCFLGNIWQQVLPWQHFFMFLGLKNLFLGGSLHSKPLHRLELISLTTITGNKCCLATLFSFSWTQEYFYGFFAFHTPAQTGADELFGNTWQQVLPWQHFFRFLDLQIFLWVLCFPYLCTDWS